MHLRNLARVSLGVKQCDPNKKFPPPPTPPHPQVYVRGGGMAKKCPKAAACSEARTQSELRIYLLKPSSITTPSPLCRRSDGDIPRGGPSTPTRMPAHYNLQPVHQGPFLGKKSQVEKLTDLFSPKFYKCNKKYDLHKNIHVPESNYLFKYPNVHQDE